MGSLATLLQLCRIQQQLLLAPRRLLHLPMPIYQPTLDLKLQLGLNFYDFYNGLLDVENYKIHFSFFDKIHCHWATHITQTNEPDLARSRSDRRKATKHFSKVDHYFSIYFIKSFFREQRTKVEQRKHGRTMGGHVRGHLYISAYVHFSTRERKLRYEAHIMNYESRELFLSLRVKLTKECLRPIKCTVRYICICYTNMYYT